jgi:site-specific DNA recombinase
MRKNIVEYARVSKEEQAQGDKASIQEQLEAQAELVERNGWRVVGVFVDKENYTAIQAPNKGKTVNPSGERADRPQFLAMLEQVRTGKIDAIVCWRDDRLVRHPRVAVALEDALDIGDTRRNSRGKIEIFEATGAIIDRFTLSIKAAIWREENKRRVERSQMGRVTTLKLGRWPGHYDRLGYEAIKEPGKRGRKIVPISEEEKTIRLIFDMFDGGKSVRAIAEELKKQGVEQKGRSTRKDDWNPAVIYQILSSEDYTGKATWNFKDGRRISIDIPPIISIEQWKRVQTRLTENKRLSPRNAGGVYLLQGLVICGECNSALAARSHRYYYGRLKDGTVKRYPYKVPKFYYVCIRRDRMPYNEAEHPSPFNFEGASLDWDVWRYVVDNGIKRPESIHAQALARHAELKAQGDSVDGDIAHARRKLSEVDQERAFHQRQAGRGKITEQEFDARMGETEEAREYWQEELARLKELRDNADRVQAGLDYVTDFLTHLEQQLAGIDQSPDELETLPDAERQRVLRKRQKIIRALCDKVYVHADGRVRIEGVLDGSEAAEFELGSLQRCWWDKRSESQSSSPSC